MKQPWQRAQTCAFLLLFLVFPFCTELSAQENPLPKHLNHIWSARNVNDVAFDSLNQRIFIGGAFTYVGPQNPNASLLSKEDGSPVEGSAIFGKEVYCTLADDHGGYYVGGAFTQVNGQERLGLAQIDSLGQLLEWAPSVNGTVRDLHRIGDTLFVVGTFTKVEDVDRLNFAAVHAISGELLPIYKHVSGEVRSITAKGDSLFIGGDFQRTGNYGSRGTALRVDDAQPTHYYPRPAGNVFASVPDGNGGWFIGGNFLKIGDQDRLGLAHIDEFGQLTPWNAYLGSMLPDGITFPTGIGSANSLALHDGVLYVTGNFSLVNGEERANAAAIDAESGALLPWNPQLNNIGRVIDVIDNRIMLGGDFQTIGSTGQHGLLTDEGGSPENQINLDLPTLARQSISDGEGGFYVVRNSAVQFSTEQHINRIDSTGQITPFTLGSSHRPRGVRSMKVYNGVLIVAATEISSLSGQGNAYMAFYNGTTGNRLPISFALNGRVDDLNVIGDRLFLAGQFSSVNGEVRNGLASINLLTQDLEPWTCSVMSSAGRTIHSGDTLYVTGSFNTVGHAQYGLALDVHSLEPSYTGASPNGVVSCAISDGGDGWYIGGAFTKMGDSPREGFGHISSDGDLQPFAPSINGSIRSMLIRGDSLLIAGDFTSVNDQPRQRFACFNRHTFELLAWSPTFDNEVKTLLLHGNVLYAGGAFTQVSNNSRLRLAAFNADSGTLLPWNPSPNNQVNALAINGDLLIAAGQFSNVFGSFRSRICAFNLSSGALNEWNPNINNQVNSVVVANNKIYVAGNFTSVDGNSRNRLAVFDSSGTLNPFQSNLSFSPGISSLAIMGDTLICAGDFSISNQGFGSRMGAVNAISGEYLSEWIVRSNQPMRALALNGNKLYAGGESTILGGLRKGFITAISTETAEVFDWDSNLNSGFASSMVIYDDRLLIGGTNIRLAGSSIGRNFREINRNTGTLLSSSVNASGSHIHSLAVLGDNLYVAGTFNTVNGTSRLGAASIDLSDNSVRDWQAQHTGTVNVNTLSISGDQIFVGGDLPTTGGISQSYFASFEIGENIPLSWGPNINSSVYAFAHNENHLFVGGSFTSPGSRVIKVDLQSGSTIPWSPNPNNAVSSLALSGDTLFLGGFFTQVSNQSRGRIAAVKTETNELLDLNIFFGSLVHDVAVDANHLYVGGAFESIGGVQNPPRYLARIDRNEGVVDLDWRPEPLGAVQGTQVSCLSRVDEHLYVGGNFNLIGGSLRHNIAGFQFSEDPDGLSPLDFAPNPMETINVLLASSDLLYSGGNAEGAGLSARNLRAYEYSGSVAGNWNNPWINPNGAVQSLLHHGEHLFVGGRFTVLGNERMHIAQVNATSGALTSWNPGANSWINDLKMHENVLYAGGRFTEIGGMERTKFAALEPSSGTVLDLNVLMPSNEAGWIESIGLKGKDILLGGSHSSAGGVARNGLACLDLNSGLPTDFAPHFNNPVINLEQDPENLYAGGAFSQVDQVNSGSLVGFDLDSLVLEPSLFPGNALVRCMLQANDKLFAVRLNQLWVRDLTTGETSSHPGLISSGQVTEMAQHGDYLYLGGDFTASNNPGSQNLIALNISDFSTASFDLSTNGRVRALQVNDGYLYASGDFTSIAGAERKHLARIKLSDHSVGNWEAEGIDVPIHGIQEAYGKLYAGAISEADVLRIGLDSAEIETGIIPDAQALKFRRQGQLLALVGNKPVANWSTAFGIYDLNVCPTEAICQSAEISLNEEGFAVLDPGQIDGGSNSLCLIESIAANQTTFDCSHLGENDVMLTVTDATGFASSCLAHVQVMDLVAPTLSLQNISVGIPATGSYTLDVNEFILELEDNCEVDTVFFSAGNTVLSCADEDSTLSLEITAVDASGNSISEMVEVHVEVSEVCCAATAEWDESSYNICPGDSVLLQINLQGIAPYSLIVDGPEGSLELESDDDAISFWVAPESSTTYSLLSINDANCEGLIDVPGVLVDVIGSQAGPDVNLLLCGDGSPLDLITFLGEGAQTDGVFVPPFAGTADTLNSGTYLYLAAHQNCPVDTAMIQVQFEAPLEVNNLLSECVINPFYHIVSFEVTGGVPPYILNGTALPGNTYISDSLLIADAPALNFFLEGFGICPPISFTAFANDADGNDACDDAEYAGCMDPAAPNYDPLATIEGECYLYEINEQTTSENFFELPTGGFGRPGGGEEWESAEDGSPWMLRVYPNPAMSSQEIWLALEGLQDESEAIIELFDVSARLLYQERVQGKGTQFAHPLDLKLSAGVYMLKVEHAGSQAHARLVISR